MTSRFISTGDFASGHLVGYINCSYADLVKVFGEPTSCDGYKTSSEWCIVDTETGEKFSVYDYKDTNLYDSDAPSVEEFRAAPSYDWHIGGKRMPDKTALTQFIKEHAA
jgi:hypothetical protein